MYTQASKTTIKSIRELAQNTLSDLTISEYITQVFVIRSMLKCEETKGFDEVKTAINIIETSLNATDTNLDDFDSWEFKELLEQVLEEQSTSDDFYIDLPCGDVRVIDCEAIEQIWHDSLIEQIKECYDLSNVPSFIEIDWDKTADNCKVDGRGHHFSSYDGEEHNSDTHYIFRTN